MLSRTAGRIARSVAARGLVSGWERRCVPRATEQQNRILDLLPDRYRALAPSEDYYFSLFNNATFGQLVDDESSTSVEVVTFNEPFIGVDFRSRSLYLRSFYPDLLRTCLGYKHVVLLGNEGTSKTVLHFAILAGLLLPPSIVPAESALRVVQEKLKGIKVIVWQVGELVDLIALDEKLQFTGGSFGGGSVLKDVMKIFAPQDILYLYDPATSFEPPLYNFQSPRQPRVTLSTMWPKESCYQGYAKQAGAREVYMPLYTKSELVLIGRHMQDQSDFPEPLRSLYTEEKISARYTQFGGEIRNVLPQDRRGLSIALEGQQSAYGSVTPDLARRIENVIAHNTNMIESTLNNRLVLLDSVRRPDPRSDFGHKFALVPSMDLANRLAMSLRMGTLEELRALLMITEACRTETEEIRARTAFAQVLCKTMTTTTLKWWQRPMVSKARANANKYKQLNIRRMELVERTVPYAELKAGQLVCPAQENFPLADMYYLEKNGTLVIIQMWFGSTNKEDIAIAESEIEKFEEELKIAIRRKDAETKPSAAEGAAGKPVKVKLVLVSAFSEADAARYSNCESFQNKDLSMFVWKPPKDYTAGL